VLDTNVIVSGLIQPLGNPAKVLTLALAGVVQVCHEKRVLAEYEEVLARPHFKFDEKRVREVLTKFKEDGQAVDTAGQPNLCLPDPDDEPFLETALAGKADYLITGNLAHLSCRKPPRLCDCFPGAVYGGLAEAGSGSRIGLGLTVGQAQFSGASVRAETFDFGECGDTGEGFAERGAIVFNEAGAALELVHGEAGKGCARATGGEDVAGAGDVIAEHGGGPRAEKDCASRDDGLRNFAGVAGHDFAMLGSELVGQCNGIGQGPHVDEPAVGVQGFADKIAAGQMGKLLFDFFLD
jgi:putative PIN family toxin of toxin-antitoxin system